MMHSLCKKHNKVSPFVKANVAHVTHDFVKYSDLMNVQSHNLSYINHIRILEIIALPAIAIIAVSER